MEEKERISIMYEMVSRLAAEGNAEAQCVLGYMEFCGENPDETYEEQKAVELFRKSAEQGWACAQYNLGWCYYMGWCPDTTFTDPETGEDGFHDSEKANRLSFEWYMKAALQGADKAQTAVGLAYLWEIGVERDLDQALLWLNRAAEQDEVEAQCTLVSLYAEDERCQDIKKALHWARMALNHLPDYDCYNPYNLHLEMGIHLPSNESKTD